MMDPIMVHENDLNCDYYLRLGDIESGEWLDLSDSTTTVTAKFRKVNTTTVLQSWTLSKLFGGATGYVKFVWPAAALDVDKGTYEIEISVDFDGRIQTANKHFWVGSEEDWSVHKAPVKVRSEF